MTNPESNRLDSGVCSKIPGTGGHRTAVDSRTIGVWDIKQQLQGVHLPRPVVGYSVCAGNIPAFPDVPEGILAIGNTIWNGLRFAPVSLVLPIATRNLRDSAQTALFARVQLTSMRRVFNL